MTTLFTQTVIAVIWDFDKTLIPGYMQEPLFDRYGLDEREFWDEVNGLTEHYKETERIIANKETIYLNHLLTYANTGLMNGLTNRVLRDAGADIRFFPGLPSFFHELKRNLEDDELFRSHGITVEHYIVSTGLRQMILGSRIAPFVEDVWGCEFLEAPAPRGFMKKGVQVGFTLPAPRPRANGIGLVETEAGTVQQVAYVLDNTTKTRAIFEINKGSNKHDIDVNAKVQPEDRRVPFQNMIYIADGPSDVPVYSVLKQNGGRTYAVYGRGALQQFEQAKRLQEQGRVQSFGEADYTEGSQTYLWLTTTAREIARRIVGDRQATLNERVLAPPRHIQEQIETRPEIAPAPVIEPARSREATNYG